MINGGSPLYGRLPFFIFWWKKSQFSAIIWLKSSSTEVKRMSISVEKFGRLSSRREQHLITIKEDGIEASFTELGASLVSLKVPNREGKMTDIVMGYSSAGEYEADKNCMGAVCGRFAGRLSGSEITVGGRSYKLDKNARACTLHGGHKGFQKREWGFEEGGPSSVAFSLVSEDGDMGFPGELYVVVIYSLFPGPVPVLDIFYSAYSDCDTVVNLTNHSYFNLSGHDSGDKHQQLFVNADFYNPLGKYMLPTGEIRSVKGTPLDFTTIKDVASCAESDDEQIRLAGGLDHCFLLNRDDREMLAPAGRLFSPKTGITMDPLTTSPAMTVYTANGLSAAPGKGGAVYSPRGAVCMECQIPPDSMRHTHFPSPYLRGSNKFTAQTSFIFNAFRDSKE